MFKSKMNNEWEVLTEASPTSYPLQSTVNWVKMNTITVRFVDLVPVPVMSVPQG